MADATDFAPRQLHDGFSGMYAHFPEVTLNTTKFMAEIGSFKYASYPSRAPFNSQLLSAGLVLFIFEVDILLQDGWLRNERPPVSCIVQVSSQTSMFHRAVFKGLDNEAGTTEVMFSVHEHCCVRQSIHKTFYCCFWLFESGRRCVGSEVQTESEMQA